jgi:DUF1365 family protein
MQRPPAMPGLYVSKVMHARHDAHASRFRYRIFRLLLDIDRLEETARRTRLFSIDRFNLFSFRRRDHGPRNGGSLRAWAEERLRGENIELHGGSILLLATPRIFGYAFNPISLWYCHDDSGSLRAVICEVRNTFGEYHTYVVTERVEEGALEDHTEKRFHVSPFMALAGGYDFRITAPADEYLLHIDYSDGETRLLTAVESGRRRQLTDRALLRIIATMPFVTFKIMVAIHWQALKLWLRGATFHPHPGRSRKEITK